TLWRVESLMRHRSDRPKFANRSHLTLRFTADVFPRFSSISYSRCCPSLSVVSPARSTAEMWTSTSFSPLGCRPAHYGRHSTPVVVGLAETPRRGPDRLDRLRSDS